MLAAIYLIAAHTPSHADDRNASYTPSQEIIQAQKEFSDARFGIFIHWGIYSMFAQGEWYLHNANLDRNEYAKAAAGFYPADFNAAEWVSAIKQSGARYICFTSRHHDSFSMWHTAQSPYNIVDATPYKKDILKELAEECHKQGIKLHLYYSHLDWTRDEYPQGRTGHGTGRDSTKADWPAYYGFMNRQITELLTGYGKIGAIWFDGWWDHDCDSIPFDWELEKQYRMIHDLQPWCLIGNNHHQTPFPGEDIQIFERDLPGENSAGLSGQAISRLPLETCQTMNGMWGYKIADQNYKDSKTLIHYLIRTAGMGANLLLNIGPQPNGQLPAAAVSRLAEMGEWLGTYGETVYGTSSAGITAAEWGTATVKGDRMFLHILQPGVSEILLPAGFDVREAFTYTGRRPVQFQKASNGETLISLEPYAETTDHIIELKIQRNDT